MKTRLRVNRLVSFLLINALLLPVIVFDLNHTISARTNFTPPKLSVPNSAPPEPYIFSSGANSATVLPTLTALGTTISSSYSAMAVFITGAETPQGLGAATPPPTFTERLTGFFASLFVTKEINSEPAAPPFAGAAVAFDFDGDSRADYSRWQANSFQYKIYNSNSEDYTTLNLGSSGSKIAPADFDGDGKFDMAVFSAGAWTVRKSSTDTNWSVSWGTTGDLPVAADFDGDHTADFAIYRPSTNTFWVLTSGSGYASYTSTALGSSGDIVVPGDFEGDGKADCAVFRPSNGRWYYKPSSGGSVVETAWGVSSDIPAPGDFDGDGKTDMTVFRPSTGTWYVLKSRGGSPNYFQTSWGNLGDQPVPADYDGDSTTDLAIYRPTTGAWWILRSSDSNTDVFNLGTSSDTAVPSAYLKQSGAELYPDQLSPARLAPINATGGTNYYSRNSAWGTNLVSLPGRSGFNLNIGMGYNSLVWTKVGSVMAFDMDHSNISPGFNFGFPRIEPAFVSSQTSILSYLMVLPSGARTEFRQTAAGDTYETADSSYAQIKVNNPGTANNPTPIEDITLTITGTDGTQMSYLWIGNAYRCTQIKDSNGNYITISNNTDGQLTSVTDTLGRVVTVNYDGYSRPSSITQNWQTSNGSSSTTTTHNWATFTYTTRTIGTSFYNLSVFGPANDTSISVLQKVTYSDGSYTKFDHNGYGQVYKISTYAPNNDLLNYTWRNIESPSSNQPDCPRFTQTKIFAVNFNNGDPVTVNNSFSTGYNYSLPGSISGTATKIEIAMEDDPYDSVTKTSVGSSGWMEGLPIATEDYADNGSGVSRQRWTWSEWTQDNTNASYTINPRVTETQVGDASNTKKTEIDYYLQTETNISTYGLIKEVRVYDANLSTVLKTAKIEYVTSTNYLSRRIIGLPSKAELYEGTNTPMSMVTYDYDESGYSGTGQSVSATQHDAANYGTSFSYRGNLTRNRRWNVSYPTTESASVNSQIKYNITGSQISQTDPRGRVSTISYTDNWNDSVSRNATYAYPTTFTDPGNNSSNVEYRYDIGANVWAQNPAPAGQTVGKTTTREFDSIGRLLKETVLNTGAYMRFEFPNPDNGVQRKVYSTLVDVDGDTNIAEDEVLTESWTDGAGRVRQIRTENPNSYGEYKGRKVEYDILGRVKRETVPTEINSSWNPAGDDSEWLWKEREYDWKGRVKREINTDGTDRLYSYEGCGCAGGQVTTIKGEITTATDAAGNQQTTKRRTQKIYADILGRTLKTEIWDLDGGGSAPYSTIKNTYNGRDQITNVREYSGADTSTTYQDTTMTFEGHGRLSTRHRPQEFDAANSNTPTYTTYTYHADDTVASVTDPRGAVTNYLYGAEDDESSSEDRALLTKITYSVPGGSGIIDPSNVDFTYDAAGNRASMSDGTGDLSYSYDELSRLTKETKDFEDTLTNEPTGGYILKYNYHLAGGLKSLGFWFGTNDTDPQVVTYAADKIGRVTAIGGSDFYDGTTEITSFASNINYRAFGGVKSMTYATTQATQISLSYNDRLLPSNYVADSNAVSGDVQNLNFSYFNDGQVKEAVNSVEANHSQYYDYDFAGRLKRNDFGTTQTGHPYKQTLGYDAFGNMTSRSTHVWGVQANFTAGYTNNRKSSGGYQSGVDTFDLAGNVIQNQVFAGSTNLRQWKFDAAGRNTEWLETLPYISSLYDQGAVMWFDGDGRMAKRLNRHRNRTNGNTTWSEEEQYFIYSSVTGQKITDLNDSGQKHQTFIYFGGAVIAEQRNWVNSDIVFKYNAPITGSTTETEVSGELSTYSPGKLHFEALGAVIPPDEEEIQIPVYTHGGSTKNPEYGCTNPADGAPMPCGLARMIAEWEDIRDFEDWKKKNPEGLPWEWLEQQQNPFPDDFVFADNVRHGRPGLRKKYYKIGEYSNEHRTRAGEPVYIYDWEIDYANASLLVKSDCVKFADRVREIANAMGLHLHTNDSLASVVKKFMNRLAEEFTEFSSASLTAVGSVSAGFEEGNSFKNYTSGGFKQNFNEEGGNQVRHAVGGLIAGYVLGETVGLEFMNSREDSKDEKHGVPDINLNGNTVPMGSLIAGDIKFAQSLSYWIKDNLCNKE